MGFMDRSDQFWDLYRAGWTMQAIADEYGVNQGTVSRLIAKYCQSHGIGRMVMKRLGSLHLSAGRQGITLSEERKRQIGDCHRGRKYTPSALANMRAAGLQRRGKTWNTGKPLSPEHRARISASKMGAKNWNWRGGVSFAPYGPGFNKATKARVRERDGHRCRVCGKGHEESGYLLAVHHIDYDKHNNAMENLVTVCSRCHAKTGSGDRSGWMAYFQALIALRGQNAACG